MKKAVIVLSGGIDSVCMGAILNQIQSCMESHSLMDKEAGQEIKSAKNRKNSQIKGA